MFAASVWQRLPPYPSETQRIGAISTLHLLRAAAGPAFPTHSASFIVEHILMFRPIIVAPV